MAHAQCHEKLNYRRVNKHTSTKFHHHNSPPLTSLYSVLSRFSIVDIMTGALHNEQLFPSSLLWRLAFCVRACVLTGEKRIECNFLHSISIRANHYSGIIQLVCGYFQYLARKKNSKQHNKMESGNRNTSHLDMVDVMSTARAP